jgi:hypothetical protein
MTLQAGRSVWCEIFGVQGVIERDLDAAVGWQLRFVAASAAAELQATVLHLPVHWPQATAAMRVYVHPRVCGVCVQRQRVFGGLLCVRTGKVLLVLMASAASGMCMCAG